MKRISKLSGFQVYMVGLGGTAGAVAVVVGAVLHDHESMRAGMTLLSATIAIAVFRKWRKLA